MVCIWRNYSKIDTLGISSICVNILVGLCSLNFFSLAMENVTDVEYRPFLQCFIGFLFITLIERPIDCYRNYEC